MSSMIIPPKTEADQMRRVRLKFLRTQFQSPLVAASVYAFHIGAIIIVYAIIKRLKNL